MGEGTPIVGAQATPGSSSEAEKTITAVLSEIVGRSTLALWLGLALTIPLPVTAATPYEAQLAGALSTLARQATFASLTGEPIASDGERLQRVCSREDVENLSFAERNAYGILINKYCDLAAPRVHAPKDEIRSLSHLGKHCEGVLSHVRNIKRAIVARQEAIRKPHRPFEISDEIAREVSLPLKLDLGSLLHLSVVPITARCGENGDLIITASLRSDRS
jgi:hypothetical protein